MAKDKKKLSKNSRSMVPTVLVESKMSNLTPIRLDVIHIVLAMVGMDTDEDNNLYYTISAENYAQLKDYKKNGKLNVDHAYDILKNKIFGDDAKKDNGILETFYQVKDQKAGWGHKGHLFSHVEYLDGKGEIELKIDDDFKELLVKVKKEKGKKIFAALQYIMPMRSVYSKRLYMMCKEFELSGVRFTEQYDFPFFREKLGVPDSYSDNKVIERVLEPGKEEINTLSDIEIDYELFYKVGKGRAGKVISGVLFRIVKKSKDQITGQLTFDDFPDCLPEPVDTKKELRDQIRKIFPKLTNADISCIVQDADAKEVTDENLLKIVEYVRGKDVENVVGYVRTIINNGMSSNIRNHKKNGFSDFSMTQDYDFEALEKALAAKI